MDYKRETKIFFLTLHLSLSRMNITCLCILYRLSWKAEFSQSRSLVLATQKIYGSSDDYDARLSRDCLRR